MTGAGEDARTTAGLETGAAIAREDALKGLEVFDLSGRVAVVIGGTTGLGREIALGFAAAGADVVVSSRRQEQVDAVAAEIEALGRRTLRITSDVLDRVRSSACTMR